MTLLEIFPFSDHFEGSCLLSCLVSIGKQSSFSGGKYVLFPQATQYSWDKKRVHDKLGEAFAVQVCSSVF